MISGTYLLSGLLLFGTAWLFDQGSLSASTLTACWCAVLFFASAGASSAYLTVSEVFPMETRAMSIAFFYAIGTAAGGISGPLLFADLTGTGEVGDTVLAFQIGATLMCLAGLTAATLAVRAERRSLEDIAAPLTAAEDQTGSTRRAGQGRGRLRLRLRLRPDGVEDGDDVGAHRIWPGAAAALPSCGRRRRRAR
ncbi:hypothetical protein SVIOM74S_02011 [Streptomyces violarus]